MSRRKMFVFGDTHFKWHHKGAIISALKRLKEFNPRAVIQIGDLYDMLSFSRFARSQNFISPQQEQIQSRQQAEEFWKYVKLAAPNAELYQIMGNHDSRALKKIMEKAPEYEFVVLGAVEDMMSFKGVKTILDPREELLIDDVTFIHGYHTKLGNHMMESHDNICCGHSHRAGIMYHPWNNKIKWELNVGFLADKDAVPLSYTQRKRFSKWTLGWGEIDAEGPKFVPYKK